jgi:release factor glutamine methyltransferase
MSVTNAITWGCKQLRQVTSTTLLEAEVLMAFVLGKPERPMIYNSKEISSSQLSYFQNLIHRRSQSEPIAYLTGFKEFYSLNFQVDPRVLIPRSDSEGLVDEAVFKLKQTPSITKILDVGVGSGALLFSVLAQFNERSFLGVGCDISKSALEVAGLNADRLLKKAKHELIFCSPDQLEGKDEFEVVIANPPYLISQEWRESPQDVHNYEPTSALLTNFTFTEWLTILNHYLCHGGWLFLEWGQLPSYHESGLRDHCQSVGYHLHKRTLVQPKCCHLVLEKI